MLLLATACNPVRNFDRQVDSEETVYFDQMTSEQRSEARRVIGSSLIKGLDSYRLSAGDTVGFLFMFGSAIESEEYRIHVGDLLNIEFFYHKGISRKHRVRPDGRITLPLKGEIVATGKTPLELQALVVKLYSDQFRNPQVTVTVEEFNSDTEAMENAIRDSVVVNNGTRAFTVSPDGMIFPPFLHGIPASGSTLDELAARINAAYKAEKKNISVSLQLSEIGGNRVFVFGEVRSPGAYTLQGGQTVLQVIASAGGWLPTAAKHNIRVVYWDEQRNARVRSIDLERVAREGDASEDMILPANATIYVPPSYITLANRFVDQYIRQLFLFNGTSVSVTYEQNFP